MDSPWSTPPDGERYQSRTLDGVVCTAGTNLRGHRGDLPWTCTLGGLTDAEAVSVADILRHEGGSPRLVGLRPDPCAPSEQRLVEVRGWGVTMPECRQRAECCAGIMSRRVASLRRAVQR